MRRPAFLLELYVVNFKLEGSQPMEGEKVSVHLDSRKKNNSETTGCIQAILLLRFPFKMSCNASPNRY